MVIRGIVRVSGDMGVVFVRVERADKGTFFIPPGIPGASWPFLDDLNVRYENVHRFSVPGLDLAEFVTAEPSDR